MTIKELRAMTGLSQSKFADRYNIKLKTLQAWEIGRRNPPGHTVTMLERLVMEDQQEESKPHK